MDSELFADAQRYVGQLLGHLEEIHAALDMRAANGAEAAADPFSIVFHRSGYLQGLYLKTHGFLTADLQEFIRGLAYSFELEADFPAPLKLPFTGCEVHLQRKTLNPFHESAWESFHSGLLSAYAMRSLEFEKKGEAEDPAFDRNLRIVETPARSDAMGRQAFLEKRLSGMALLSGELLREEGLSVRVREKLRLLVSAASEAGGMT